MDYHVIHEHELNRHPELAELVREIDRRHPPVGYERLLYPWFFIMPRLNAYLRLIRDDNHQLVIPLLPVDQAAYSYLENYSRGSGCELLLVDRGQDWLEGSGLRWVPVGALQNIDLNEFNLRGARLRKLRYMVNRFASSGEARTVEYSSQNRPAHSEMIGLMEAWAKAKNNVIWHTALCMEHLLKGELPPGHRAFFTYLDGRLCSILVIEGCGPGGCLMDQEFYDPASAPLGHMEYAIVTMMEQLKREGMQVLSLGATWYPFPFENHPRTDPEAWSWLKKSQQRPTLLAKIFEQGKTNYQFKKKFGVPGEPLFAYLPPGLPFTAILNYWSVFYENSLTPPQLHQRLQQTLPSALQSPPPPPAHSASFPAGKASSETNPHPIQEEPEVPLDLGRFDRPEDRQAIWDQTQRFESIPYTSHPLDLMTDSWIGRESELVRKRVEQLTSRTTPANVQALLHDLFPFRHLIFTRQGRDAEALFYGQFPKTKRKILTTIPWTSTLQHQLANGFEVIELPVPGALNPHSEDLFKGECDLDALQDRLRKEAAEVGLAGLEALNNGTGGHPVRLSHARQLKTILRARRIPLVLDASRIMRNAALLQQYDLECREGDVWEIARQLMAEADHVIASLTKDFAIPTGGLIATNDDELAARIRQARAGQPLPEADCSLLLGAALADRQTLLSLVDEQLSLVKSLQDRLADGGIPLCGPACGHALVIDCQAYLAEPESKIARERLLRELFIQTGIRAGIHQAGRQRHGRLARCIRLAFPLGLTRAVEDEIFEKLAGFLSDCSLKIASPPLPASPVSDFSPFLENAEQDAAAAPSNHPTAGHTSQRPDRSGDGSSPPRAVGLDPCGDEPSPPWSPYPSLQLSSTAGGDIAIIGLSGRFPGADNHYGFWEGLQAGRSFIQEVPAERWDHRKYYDPALPKAFDPHKTRCKFGAFLRSHDRFDAAFFNLSAQEVRLMDPQERLALEVVWACLEDAGYTAGGLGHDVGLFSGVTYNEYQKIIPRTTHSCFLTSRLAYFFNFHGPAAALDAGCASSMAAIDAACLSLKGGRCRVAVVVGSNVIVHPDHYASLSPELSATDRPESVPFGDGDGWIPAEGVVAVLLKPLEAARRDRDHVYAVIKACALGQEGKTSWFTAFSPRRQAEFLQKSFQQAGLCPATISYVEAAANGSPLGDAIELEGLTNAFRQGTRQKHYCPIGTVKANAGHGEGVSTLLQLAKVLLQFKTGEIYPLLHPERRNPSLGIEETPFRYPTSVEAWDRPEFQLGEERFTVPRRATISSFGGGGNMGHLILEEAPPVQDSPDALDSYLIPFSARTPEQLTRTVAEALSFLERMESWNGEGIETGLLMNLMRTLWEGRVSWPHRVALVAANLEDLKSKCRLFLRLESHPDVLLAPTQNTSNGNPEMSQWIASRAWHELGRRWVSGAEVTWGNFFAARKASRVPLPTYCFDRQRHAIGEGIDGFSQPESAPTQPLNASTGLVEPADAKLFQVVKAAFSKALSLPIDSLDLDRPLDQYGFDSAMVAGVTAELGKHIPRVRPVLFFDCRTIRQVIECLGRESAEAGDLSAGSLGRTARPAAEPPETVLNIDQLAEDILAQRLTARQVLAHLGSNHAIP